MGIVVFGPGVVVAVILMPQMGKRRRFGRSSDVFQGHTVGRSCGTEIPKANSSSCHHQPVRSEGGRRDLEGSEGSGDRGVREALAPAPPVWASSAASLLPPWTSIAWVDQQFQRKQAGSKACGGDEGNVWLRRQWLFLLIDIFWGASRLTFHFLFSIHDCLYCSSIPGRWALVFCEYYVFLVS